MDIVLIVLARAPWPHAYNILQTQIYMNERVTIAQEAAVIVVVLRRG